MERVEYNDRFKALEETNVEVVMTECQRENYEKGLSQGSIQTAQQNLLLALETRFGIVPAPVRERVVSLSDLAELQRLLRLAVVAPSLEHL